jgi:hypothetical protein
MRQNNQPALPVSNIAPDIPGTAVAATGAEGDLPIIGGEAAALAPFPTETIPPAPIRTVNLPYERAAMLANAPRSKWSEGTLAAFTGMIAALPSAADAFMHACARNPFSLEFFETIQIMIWFGFFVWMIVSLVSSQFKKTSTQYLDELYPDKGTPK